jgi:spermidine synthase
MKKLVELDRTAVPGGKEMVLYQRNDDFIVHVDGRELMGSRAHSSEEQLATLGCADLRSVSGARVLVGGLGMGYTLRAALRKLGDDAQVDVAELVASVTRWNRTHLAHLAGAPLEDPRVHVIERDVLHVIKEAATTYDAILLDVDNGPQALSAPSNARLYDANGLARSMRALRPGGVLAVWSTSDDRKFTDRLTQAGFTTRIERPAARVGGSARHVLWIAKKAGDTGHEGG